MTRLLLRESGKILCDGIGRVARSIESFGGDMRGMRISKKGFRENC